VTLCHHIPWFGIIDHVVDGTKSSGPRSPTRYVFPHDTGPPSARAPLIFADTELTAFEIVFFAEVVKLEIELCAADTLLDTYPDIASA
jgi:hypothetical protein